MRTSFGPLLQRIIVFDNLIFIKDRMPLKAFFKEKSVIYGLYSNYLWALVKTF